MKRTTLQNRALHKYCELLAEALNDAGLEMKEVLAIKEVDIPWTKERVKEVLWKPVQQAMTEKESTTEATTFEYVQIYEVLNRATATKLGISVPWPNREE